MSALSLIFGSFGNVDSLVFPLLRGGGTLGNPILNVQVLIIVKIVISQNVLSVIFLLT